MKQAMKIENAHYFITGAASGLGASTARMLSERGARVTLADRNTREGQALASELGPDARFVELDVTLDAEAGRAVEDAVSAFGPLAGAICCAGIAPGEKVLGKDGIHSLAAFERTLSINVTGTFNVIRHAALAMSQNPPGEDGERGVLIATASVAAFEGQIGQAAYAASKSAVVGMTLPIARELARIGIRMMTIAPGIFETPMMSGMPESVQAALGASL